ncbi:MAG: peptidoglycan-binding protein [Spirochaetaceae bacterium]|nr:peptidoglycan-binding protein [Spirochaetaceae bacterium]
MKNDIKKNENHAILDKIYDFSMRSSADCSVSLLNRLEIALYIIFSSRYAVRYLRLEAVREILRSDFLPPVPELEDSIMECINADTVEMLYEEQNPSYEVSFRGWVITGFVVLFSLVMSLFGVGFVRMIPDVASSFLLPIGITIGVIVTVYGSLFIGSHLKELSDRFGLH